MKETEAVDQNLKHIKDPNKSKIKENKKQIPTVIWHETLVARDVEDGEIGR